MRSVDIIYTIPYIEKKRKQEEKVMYHWRNNSAGGANDRPSTTGEWKQKK